MICTLNVYIVKTIARFVFLAFVERNVSGLKGDEVERVTFTILNNNGVNNDIVSI